MGQIAHALNLRLSGSVLAFVLFAAPLSTGLAFGEPESEQSAELVTKYLDATRTQQSVLRGVQMEVDIEANLPKLEKYGKLRALRRISRLGQITYKALGFSGDASIKNEVITRYLSAESAARDNSSIAITPANYKFKYKGITNVGGWKLASFQMTPRRKVAGLYKGELWLDAKTGMPVRESGSFVKSPSIFLKKVQFIRDYEMRDGVAFPKHIESTVETRLVGRAELSINFSNFTKQENSEEDDVVASDGTQ